MFTALNLLPSLATIPRLNSSTVGAPTRTGTKRKLDIRLAAVRRNALPIEGSRVGRRSADDAEQMVIGMLGATGAVERLQSILGRPLRTYAEFVREVAPAA